MGPDRRLRLSYRISLIVAIPLLVVGLSGLIIWQSYAASMREARELTHALFVELSRQAIHRSREHLAQAERTARLLRELHDQGRLGSDRREIAARLVAIIRSQPDYTWVSWSDADGSFVGGYRASDGSIRSNISWFERDKVRMEEHVVAADGTWTFSHGSEDYGYDPRGRPFYLLAAWARQPVWTPPYVFFEQGIPGITHAVPRFDDAGRLLGVISVDFDLNRLSDIVRQASGGGVGSIFMFTPDGTLLAHPEVQVVEVQPGEEGRLLKLSDVRDPVLQAYAAAAAVAPVAEVRRVEFDAAGVRYLGAGVAFRISDEFELAVGVTAPAAQFLGPVHANLRRALLIALGVLAVGVVGSIAFANAVARPLVRMAAEMDRVAGFDLREAAGGRSVFREIDRMEHSLERMIRSLGSFACYVPRDLVRRLVTRGEVARLGGQTRTLTVFFSDIADFTRMAEGMPADELVRRLGGHFERIGGIVAETGGTVDKFIGDAVMAFWGAPEEQPDHARRAVAAALRCARSDLPTRIGMATGEVVIGNIGTPVRMNYTAMGDTVNLASRLEGLNKAYGTRILANEETARQAADVTIFRPVDVVEVAGKTRGFKVVEALAEAGDAEAARLAEATSQAFEAYAAGRFDEAARGYRGVLARCEEFRDHGPPAGWSGAVKVRKL
jgi:adenylate cyclase